MGEKTRRKRKRNDNNRNEQNCENAGTIRGNNNFEKATAVNRQWLANDNGK